MKMVIQRVTHAEVTVEGKTVGAIGQGFLVLLGVGKEDTEEIADKFDAYAEAQKTIAAASSDPNAASIAALSADDGSPPFPSGASEFQ